MPLSRVFKGSVLCGFAGVVFLAIWAKYAPVPANEFGTKPLGGSVAVRDQLKWGDLAKLQNSGFRMIIDLRPDGEAFDQLPSAIVGEQARKMGISFAYIPTPNSSIPEQVVADLARQLAKADGPVLLYCRSGKRAARVWALAEATRQAGPSPEEIIKAVVGVGQAIDDLRPQILARVAARKASASSGSEP
jgi:uncharacterized protein (TIGR01244 family)